MELLLDDKTDYQYIDAFKLNNILEPYKNAYQLVCYSSKIKDQIKFVASLYHNDQLLLRFEYIILGSYNKNKNVWMWADKSLTLNKSIIEQVKDIRLSSYDDTHSDDIKNFYKNNYSVIPTNLFCDIISAMALNYFKKKMQRIITLIRGDELIDIFIVKRIMFEKVL